MATSKEIRKKVQAASKEAKEAYKPSLAELEYLTPGSNWTSESGAISTVLFVVNQKVPASRQDKFPISVVFSDEEGNIFCVDRNIFLAKREFHNVAPEVEVLAEEVLKVVSLPPAARAALAQEASNEDDAEEEDDDDTGSTEIRSAFEALTNTEHPILEASRKAIEEQPKEASKMLAKFAASHPYNENTKPPVHTSKELASALVSYSQSPDLNNPNQTIHELVFAVSDTITAESLHKAFSPEDSETENRQFFPLFSVGHSSVGFQYEVDWDYLVGVYPAVYYNHDGVFANVQFVTVASEPAEAAEVQEKKTPEEAPQWKTGAENEGAGAAPSTGQQNVATQHSVELTLATSDVTEETIQNSIANPIAPEGAQEIPQG